ncbi:interleukin-12 receptor subunit beta-1 [Discoglossus pictus]
MATAGNLYSLAFLWETMVLLRVIIRVLVQFLLSGIPMDPIFLLVKLDPPKKNDIKFIKHGNDLKMEWDKVKVVSEELFLKEAQYMKWGESRWINKRCDENESCSNTPSKEGNEKECCLLVLEKNHAYYVQIHQKFEGGIWSEWSDSVLVPADIVHSPEVHYSLGKLNKNGKRKLNLFWNDAGEEQGDVTYEIRLTLIPCGWNTIINSMGGNSKTLEIIGGVYNVTVVAVNAAGKGPSWTSVIEEDATRVFSGNISIFESKKLKLRWEGEKRKKDKYCMVWKPTTTRDTSSKYKKNNSLTEADIPVGDFQPMQCYQITVHKRRDHKRRDHECRDHKCRDRTLGTTYYFTTSQNMGPANLVLTNLTAHSVLLKWDGFDLHECKRLLQTWVIITTDHEKNISKESYEIASVTQHLISHLSSGSLYTFDIQGITIFGEKTGISQQSVITPRTAKPFSQSVKPVFPARYHGMRSLCFSPAKGIKEQLMHCYVDLCIVLLLA